MNGPALMALAPLNPAVWMRRPRRPLPFPLDQDGCRLFARARHGLWHGVRQIGLRPGDEVLVPAYHHGSEVEALRRAGLRCVFYDAGPGLGPDETELGPLLGPRTRALQIIHYFGFPEDAARWRRWCDARGLKLIEDAAHAWLAHVDGHSAGIHGDLAIFCAYKTFGLPDGGLLLCQGAAAADSMAPRAAGLGSLAFEHAAWVAGRSAPVGQLANRLRRPRPYIAAADFALGTPRPPSLATVHALPRVADPAAAERRRENYALLLDRLAEHVHPAFRTLPEGASPFVFPLVAADRSAVLAALRARGVRALNLWSVPHPSLPAERFPRAATLRRQVLGLPVHQELRRRDLERIAAEVLAAQPARVPRPA